MENKTERSERLQKLFAHYPKVDIFFLTSDDQAFTRKDRAEAHAKSLEDKTVENFPRFVAEAVAKTKGRIAEIKAGKAAAGDQSEGNQDKDEQSGTGDEKSGQQDEGNGDESEGDQSKGDQGAGAQGAGDPSSQTPAEEKSALQARYKELFGKAANHLTGVPKLKAAIAEKEAELAKQ